MPCADKTNMKTDELISFLSTQVSWSTAGKPYHRHRRRSCRRGSNRPHALGIRSPHGCLRTHALDYLVLSLCSSLASLFKERFIG